MRYSAFHGSLGAPFSRFDAGRGGSASGYAHAQGRAAFTSSLAVASEYAEGQGFIGRFAFQLENPLEIEDSLRPSGIAAFLAQAEEEGHDGVILKNCAHTALSPGEASDLFFVFNLEEPRLVETLQEGSLKESAPTPQRGRSR